MRCSWRSTCAYHDKLRRLEPDTELTRKLADLVGNRRDLSMSARGVAQLHSIRKMYYPLIHVLFNDLTSPMVAQFLLKWPELASVKKAQAAALRKFFYANSSRSEETIKQRLIDIDKAVPLTSDPALIEPAAIKAQALAAILSPQPIHQRAARRRPFTCAIGARSFCVRHFMRMPAT